MSLVVKDITKIFGGTKKALDKVSIDFKKNQITGLIGFNGSGKTTLYNVILNFIESFEGEVLLDNKPITQEDLKYFTFLGAGTDVKNATIVKKYLLQIAELYFIDKQKALTIIEDLAAKMDFSMNLGKPIKALSKGNQQKIKVIASFLNPQAKYIILDEPFDGLDPLMVDKIAKLYMNLKDVSIIITSHRMEVVQEMCKEFYVIKDGVIIDSKEVKQKAVWIALNKEVSLNKVKTLEYVIQVTETNEEKMIKIESLDCYKEITKILIKDRKYIYSTIREKNIAESVFLGYGGDLDE